jgi:hypothetical protein
VKHSKSPAGARLFIDLYQHIVLERYYFVQFLYRDESRLASRSRGRFTRRLLTKLSTEFVGKPFSVIRQLVETLCKDFIEHWSATI